MEVGGDIIEEGDWISLNGTLGEVYLGQLPKVVPDFKNPGGIKLLSRADEIHKLGVWANAPTPETLNRQGNTERNESASAAPCTCFLKQNGCRSS